MKNKILLIISITLICTSSLFSKDFNECIDVFSANQNKISSFVGAGKMTINIFDENNNSMHSLDSNITIYMKQPDSFKLEVDSGTKMTVVQKGDTIMQKDYNSNSIQTSKADSNTDLFKKYFFLGMEDLKDDVIILKKSVVKNYRGDNLYGFRIKSNSTDSINTEYGQEFTISYIEYFFNEYGMLEKSSVFTDNNEELVATEIEYDIKKNIYIADKITIINHVDKMKLVNIIEYSVISLNIEITDREFLIK